MQQFTEISSPITVICTMHAALVLGLHPTLRTVHNFSVCHLLTYAQKHFTNDLTN